MKVLSLFDGISCARVALDRANIKVNSFYASEIDKYAIEVSKKNYPDIKHIGSVVDVKGEDYKDIELLVGGSPCQDLSIAGKRKGLSGERSGLFYEYVRILKEVKPKYFILENVASMSKEAKQTITDELFGIEPVMINASLVSAQNRKRLFWVGKLDEFGTYQKAEIPQPEDRGILLKDILEDEVDEKYYMTQKQVEGVLQSNYRDRKPIDINKKIPTLKVGGDIKRIVLNGKWRYLTPVEYERGQSLKDNYTEGVSNTQRYKQLGNAFNVDVVAHIIIKLTLPSKHLLELLKNYENQ